MNGHSYNKKKRKLIGQEGQVLLLIVLLLATVMTVVMTVIFTARTESKTTKLEQESQKSLAAAEAGIEAAMKQGADTTDFKFEDHPESLGNLTGIDMSKSTVTINTTSTTEFVSPLRQSS